MEQPARHHRRARLGRGRWQGDDHPAGHRRPAAAARVQAADQPLLHAGRRRAVGGRHPGARDPAHRRLRRARRVRLHGRRSPVRCPASPSSTSRCTPRPTTSSRSTTGRPLASLTDRARVGGRPHRRWPTWIIDFLARRREDGPAGRRRRRGPGRRDRRPADQRHRGDRHRHAAGPRRARDHRRRARAWRCSASASTPRSPRCCGPSPTRIPDAVEELLRLDGSFICIGRTARHDTELGGRPVQAGERVMIYWASANRDEDEFDRPDDVRPRPRRQPPHRLRRRAAPLRRARTWPA